MMQEPSLDVAVYADVDVNYIDGSSVWLVSLVSVLARIPHVAVHLLLKAPVARDLLLQEVSELNNVHITEPDRRLTPQAAVSRLASLDVDQNFGALIFRGRNASLEAIRDHRIGDRVWSYLTDVPQQWTEMTADTESDLLELLAGSYRLLCQTETLRSWFSHLDPSSDSKLVLLPPMIPSAVERPHDREWAENGLHVFYAGKFAPDWYLLEMVEQVERTRADGTPITLHVVGDKIHTPSSDPEYPDRVRKALESKSVVWHGGVARDKVFELLEDMDVAVSIRSPALNDSRELSTKVLEYAATGVPVILNRTRIHEELLGTDYPYFLADVDDLSSLLHTLAADPETARRTGRAIQSLSQRFTFDEVAKALADPLSQLAKIHDVGRHRDARRIYVIGHDLKFADYLTQVWKRAGDEIHLIQWRGDADQPSPPWIDLRDNDILFCEWTWRNAEHFSQHPPSNGRVITRFHRMELASPYPALMNADNVDRIVFVGDHIRDAAIEEFGWSPEKTVVIPNAVDTTAFDRPKLPGADWTLGLLGFLPRLKKLDRALDLLKVLRRYDPRFRLSVKGPMPQELAWLWKRNSERRYFQDVFARIRCDPALATAVTFERSGPDIASWFRTIGYVLSPSEVESFHLALVEGMASRAVPVVWQRPGASAIVDPAWVREGTMAAAEWIMQHFEQRGAHGERARLEARERYDIATIVTAWEDLFASLTSADAKH